MRLEGNKIAYERWTYDFPVLLELLERANLEQDLRLAAEVQNALLPRTRRVGTYFEVVGASLACRAIGGDFFEYIDLPCDRFAFALGDVAGMGVSAALLASMVQGIMATEAATNSGPADVLSHVNGALLRRELESRFATAFYAVLTPEGGLTYCNGGHNPPFLLSDHETRRLVEGGCILGTFADASFSEGTANLKAGDLILLYSDGVTEALNMNGEEFGDERLLACLDTQGRLSPAVLLDSILKTVRQFCGGAVQNDDITAMVLRFNGAEVVK